MFYLWLIVRKSTFLSIAPSYFMPDREMYKSVFSIGLPPFFMKGIYVVGFLVQNNAAAAFGDIYVATFGLIFKIVMMPKQMCLGLCMGVQPLVGYSSTAGQFERMKETVRKTLTYATLLGFAFALAVFAASGSILQLFIDRREIINIGTPFLRITVVSFFAYGSMYTTTTLFQATGNATPAFVVSPVQEAVIMLGTVFMGVWGIAWAVPAGDVMAMLIGFILHVAYRKRLYNRADTVSPVQLPARPA